MLFNTTSKASIEAFNGVPATGIPPAIGERTLRLSRMTLLDFCIKESSWRVEVSRRIMVRDVCLFTVTGVRLVEAGTVELPVVQLLLDRFRMRGSVTLPRIPIM